MQVTHATLPLVLPRFVELLESCDFYALDEEMTGIQIPELEQKITSTLDECYEQKRLAAQRYSIIQVGICLFHKVTPTHETTTTTTTTTTTPPLLHYEARPFNFIVFPGNRDGGEASTGKEEVTLNLSAVSFLRQHGMDFHKWIYEGMTVCNADTATQKRAAVWAEYGESLPHSSFSAHADDTCGVANDNAESPQTPPSLTLNEEESVWVESSWAAARAFANPAPHTNTPFPPSAPDEAEAHTTKPAEARTSDAACAEADGGEAVLVSAPPSAWARRALERRLRSHPDTAPCFLWLEPIAAQRWSSAATRCTTTTTSSDAPHSPALSWRVRRMRPAERAAAVLRAARALPDALGFALVWRALQRSRKPCTGHHCFADLLFLCDALDARLPARLSTWCQRVHEHLLPCVYDTRYMASRTDCFAESKWGGARWLGGLFEAMGGLCGSPAVRVTLPLGFGDYDAVTTPSAADAKSGGGDVGRRVVSAAAGGGAAHEAAYDALMTGTVFLHLLAEWGLTSVTQTPLSMRNRVAVFGCLYALRLDGGACAETDEGEEEDGKATTVRRRREERKEEGAVMDRGAGDVGHHAREEKRVRSSASYAEYTPARVLDLRHDASTTVRQLKEQFCASGVSWVTLHKVEPTQSLAVLPRQACVEQVTQEMTSRLATMGGGSVSEYVPPHHRHPRSPLAAAVQEGCAMLKSAVGGGRSSSSSSPVRTLLRR